MEWTSSLETNIHLIDSQHQEIVKRINDVLLAGNDRKRPELISLTLDLLADFCATHFSQEENLQLRSNYPEYKPHKKLHVDFLNEIRKYHEVLEVQGASKELAYEIKKRVEDWLINHINVVDKKLGAYLFEVGFLE